MLTYQSSERGLIDIGVEAAIVVVKKPGKYVPLLRKQLFQIKNGRPAPGPDAYAPGQFSE